MFELFKNIVLLYDIPSIELVLHIFKEFKI